MTVILNDEEMALMKKAKKERDWKILTSFKLRYAYQRYVALPAKDYKAVQDIAKMANEQLDDKRAVDMAERIFE